MACRRCGNATGSSCNCYIKYRGGVFVPGSGTISDPYILEYPLTGDSVTVAQNGCIRLNAANELEVCFDENRFECIANPAYVPGGSECEFMLTVLGTGTTQSNGTICEDGPCGNAIETGPDGCLNVPTTAMYLSETCIESVADFSTSDSWEITKEELPLLDSCDRSFFGTLKYCFPELRGKFAGDGQILVGYQIEYDGNAGNVGGYFTLSSPDFIIPKFCHDIPVSISAGGTFPEAKAIMTFTVVDPADGSIQSVLDGSGLVTVMDQDIDSELGNAFCITYCGTLAP